MVISLAATPLSLSSSLSSSVPLMNNLALEGDKPKDETPKEGGMMMTIVDSTPIVSAQATPEKPAVDSKAAIDAARQVN